eukprot:1586668-Rhodomonas_salina.1
MARKAYAINKKQYLNCTVLDPPECRGDTVVLPISRLVLTTKQVAAGKTEDYSQQVTQTLLNLWCNVPITVRISRQDLDSDLATGEPDGGGSVETASQDRQFNDPQRNEVWCVFASQMITGYEELEDIDMLKPDPPNRQAVMKNVCLSAKAQGYGAVERGRAS